MTDTFDRTQLAGKDRGQLSEIAAALGVKAVSRMRKAELADAIASPMRTPPTPRSCRRVWTMRLVLHPRRSHMPASPT